MIELLPVAARAADLRNTFDQARAIPSSSDAVARIENLLAIRVSGDAFAIRLSEICGLATDRKIVAFPSPIAELLGIAAIRGRLVPVYSLAALLGYSAHASQGRWLILCGVEEPLGLVINDFEGQVRVPLGQIYTAAQEDAASTHVSHVVRTADMIRGLVSIPLIMETIQRRCGERAVPVQQES
jgi:chemotaxis signal transduction protein